MAAINLEQIRAVFLKARELPADQRPAYLGKICGDNAVFRQEVERLLRADRTETLAVPQANGGKGNRNPKIERAAPLSFPVKSLPAGYRFVRELGRGGQAVVCAAVQQSTGRTVAIKIMRDGPLANTSSRARFDREAQVLAALRHPYVVKVLDRGVAADSSQYIVMDYVEGQTLSEWLCQRFTKPTESEGRGLLRMFMKICSAVNAAHLRGIVHRDIKPSNILMDEKGEPYVLDFGLARPLFDVQAADAPMTLTGEFLGSLPWSSPEQAEGDPDKIDTRTDVYALGVILYQLLTGGQFPYEVAGNLRDVLNNILTAEPTPPSRVMAARQTKAQQRRRIRRPGLPAVGEVIEAIVLKTLSKRRDDRYQSAGELEREIANYLAGLPTVAAGQRTLMRRGRNEIMICAVTAVVLVLTIALTWDLVSRYDRHALVTNSAVAGKSIPENGESHHQATNSISVQPGAANGLGLTPQPRADEFDWFVELNGSNDFYASPGVPQAAVLALESARTKGVEIESFAFTRTGNWFIVSGKRLDGSNEAFSEYPHLKEDQQNDLHTRCVAFAPSGPWITILYNNLFWGLGSLAWYKVRDLDGSQHERRSVAFGPGDSFVFLYDKTGVSYGDIPPELAVVLDNAVSSSIEIECVAFSGRDWICLAQDHWWTSNRNLPASKIIEQLFKAGQHPKWIAFVPRSPARPAGVQTVPSAVKTQRPSVQGMPEANGPAHDSTTDRSQFVNTIGMKFVEIKPGSFVMGSRTNEPNHSDNETQHKVMLTKPFFLGVYHVTRGQFAAFVKDTAYRTDAQKKGRAFQFQTMINGASWQNPGFEQADDHPVVEMSWNDAQAFCQWLSRKEGRNYRLPTEAEWEYACRAGTQTAYFWGDSPGGGAGFANCADLTLKERVAWNPGFNWQDGFVYTSPVGSFKPNAWRLYDMVGEAWEWCSDYYGPYGDGAVVDPAGPAHGDNSSSRVRRGGSWLGVPRNSRAAYREESAPDFPNSNFGFRVALD